MAYGPNASASEQHARRRARASATKPISGERADDDAERDRIPRQHERLVQRERQPARRRVVHSMSTQAKSSPACDAKRAQIALEAAR